MHHVQTRTLVTVGIIALLLTTMVLAINLADPSSSREFAARQLGGTFLGTDGVVIQDKSNNCGPAALKMILQYLGKDISLRDLENGIRGCEGGWSMKALTEIAERHGVRSTGWVLSVDDLCRTHLPAILFVENRHFVVVDSADGNGSFYVRDPALGRLKFPVKALNKIWTGKALVFGEGEQPD